MKRIQSQASCMRPASPDNGMRSSAVIRCARRVSFVVVLAVFLTVSNVLLFVCHKRIGFIEWLPSTTTTLADEFRDPVSGQDAALLVRTLRVASAAMDAANISYFMSSGTILGSFRHHGRIPWDDDVDIIVRKSDREKLRRTLEALGPDFLLYAYVADGIQWKVFSSDAHRVPFHAFRWPYVDIFFYGENSTHVWNECPWFADEIFRRSSVFPLQRRPFDGLLLPAPCDVLSVVRANFDATRCSSSSFNHMNNYHRFWRRPAVVDCSLLADRFPFVSRRRWKNATTGRWMVTESLRIVKNGTWVTRSQVDLPDDCRANDGRLRIL